MKIIEEPKTSTVFYELDQGDVFNYDGVWYMKVETVESNEDSYFNAVDLCNGVLEHFPFGSEVDYRDVELRVRDI